MTGNVFIDLAISISGVILLVGIVRLIFGAPRAPLTVSAAADRLAFDEPDFEPAAWLADERGAIAVNADGEAALVRPLGDDLVTRRLKLADLRWRREGARLIVEGPDHAFSGLAVSAPDEEDAKAWAARLGG